MTTRRLVLLRHGRTAWNAQHRFQGRADPPLDDTGRAQAAAAARAVSALRPDVIVSSTAMRAVQTAQILAAATGLPVRHDARLCERGLGHWEGLTVDEVAQRWPDEYAAWIAGRDPRGRGGESRDQVAQRVCAAVHDLPDVPLAVLVMHGASAMALTNALLRIDQDVRPLISLENCHWTELVATETPPGREEWRLQAHNVGAPDGVTSSTRESDARLAADDEALDARA